MNHLHMNRNHRPEMAVIRQTVQYTFFLVVCVWLLYQIHHSLYVRRDTDCDYIENRFTDERIAKVLGRKGGASGSHYVEEVELYGVDIIGEAANMNNVTGGDGDQSDTSSAEGNGVVESADDGVTASERKGAGKVSAREGEIVVKTLSFDDQSDDRGEEPDKVEQEEVEGSVIETVDKRVNASVGDGSVILMSEKQGNEDGVIRKWEGNQEPVIQSLDRVNAVILKKTDNLEVFRFSDENGVPEHDSGPSRRSDVEFNSARKGSISKAGNQTNAVEACQKVSVQNLTDKHSSSKSGRQAVDKEVQEMVVVKPAKASMRDLLLSQS